MENVYKVILRRNATLHGLNIDEVELSEVAEFIDDTLRDMAE